MATGLYAHVNPERLPYNSVLSQHFAKTRQLGERTERFDERMDELCRDTIKNTIISLIYGAKDTDHIEAVSYELATHLMIAGGAYLLLLALVIMFNHGAHKR